MAAKLLKNGLIKTHDTSTKRKGELIHEKRIDTVKIFHADLLEDKTRLHSHNKMTLGENNAIFC